MSAVKRRTCSTTMMVAIMTMAIATRSRRVRPTRSSLCSGVVSWDIPQHSGDAPISVCILYYDHDASRPYRHRGAAEDLFG